MDQLDNPVGRVVAVLERGKTLDFANTPVVSGFTTILQAPEAGNLMARLGDFIRLIEESKAAVRALPEDAEPDYYFQPLKEVDEIVPLILSHLGSGGMSDFARFFRDDLIFMLGAASRIVRKHSHSPVLDDQAQADLLATVRGLIDEVSRSSELSPEAKLYLLKLLRDVEGALISFHVVGFESVAASVAAIAAGAIVLDDVKQRGWLKAQVEKLWGQMISIAHGVSQISAVVNDGVGAIETVNKIIS